MFANLAGGPLDAQNVLNRHYNKPLLRQAGLSRIRVCAFTMQRYTHHNGMSAGRTARAMDEASTEPYC